MATCWWKFTLTGTGTHLVRVTHIGTDLQEVWLDGSPLQAPPNTVTFTGPAATLLELLNTDAGWVLTVDGTAAEVYSPDAGPVEAPAVAWWRFTAGSAGTHHLRVTNIGTGAQVVFLDGAPLDAPPGTMMFTGPAASLLELQQREHVWVLAVDGKVVHQQNPNVDPTEPLHRWSFEVPGMGPHEVSVAHLGARGQEIHLDGVLVPAPDGTMMFTGPGGVLLELQRGAEGGWSLLVDGSLAQASGGDVGAASDIWWTIIPPGGGDAHQMRVLNAGRPDQQVFLDGVLVEAPPGSTMFTGPGGALLELRRGGHAWSLYVDGLSVEDHNLQVRGLHGGHSGRGAAVATSVAAETLPQGVSYDSDAGVYKANIRVRGKFKFLGDFPTAEEAHQRYLDAKAELEA